MTHRMFQSDYTREDRRTATVGEIWNWQENVRLNIEKLRGKRARATQWMQSLGPNAAMTRPIGQRPQSQLDNPLNPPGVKYNSAVPAVVGGIAVPVPDQVVANCDFVDGTATPVEDAVTIALFNGEAENPAPGEFGSDFYLAWNNTALPPNPLGWVFTTNNVDGVPYVAQVCAEVDP